MDLELSNIRSEEIWVSSGLDTSPDIAPGRIRGYQEVPPSIQDHWTDIIALRTRQLRWHRPWGELPLCTSGLPLSYAFPLPPSLPDTLSSSSQYSVSSCLEGMSEAPTPALEIDLRYSLGFLENSEVGWRMEPLNLAESQTFNLGGREHSVWYKSLWPFA